MKTKKYNWILYLITTTIVLTIVVQFYWNYKNFQENKKRVANEIQISLDNAVEEYFSTLSKNNFFAFLTSDSIKINRNIILNRKDFAKDSAKVNVTSMSFSTKNPKEFSKASKLFDSLMKVDTLKSNINNRHIRISDVTRNVPIRFPQVQNLKDTARIIRGVKSVILALNNEDIDFSKLDSLFSKQLEKKGIESTFYFQYFDRDSIIANTQKENQTEFFLYSDAKSTYLRNTQQLKAFHTDPTISALKRSSTGILLSLLLSLTVIGSLFYLLKVINKQKELAEIKNDLISNITHEFKTPIATVSTAIEAIENFNVIDDKEKTQKYLSMSSVQLKKLHQMVEKLLETATLDSENLILKKEKTDIVGLIEKLPINTKCLQRRKSTFHLT